MNTRIVNRVSNQTPFVPAYRKKARVIAVRRGQDASAIHRIMLAGVIGILALVMMAMAARAQEAPPPSIVPLATIEAMQTVIRGQIDAFQANDAEAAYAYAAPGVQQRFASPARFVAMVRQGYSTVFEHQSFSFIDEALTPLGPAQRVEFVSEDGQVWGGIYTFEQADDGELFISGVMLRRENARQI